MKKQPIRILWAFVGMTFLLACAPHDVQAVCKQNAIAQGWGKCSVLKARQNTYGVWIVQMDCSGGLATCQNNTAGRVFISEWTSMSEYLYQDG